MNVPLAETLDPDCSSYLPLNILNGADAPLTVYGMPLWGAIVLIAALLLISGLFSASENAFSNCDKYHFKIEADKGKLTSKIIVRLTERFEDTLVAVLVGNNIVQTLMSSISAVIFYEVCNELGFAGLDAILSTVVMGFLVYLISDTCPKILSKAIPNRMAIVLAWPDFLVGILLFPLIFIFRFLLKGVHRIFRIKDENMLTKEDFLERAKEAKNVEDSEETGEKEEETLFEENEQALISKAFVFDSIPVKDVFTKKEDISYIEGKSLSIAKVNALLLSSPYSRFPVMGEDGECIGILSSNVYFQEYNKDEHLSILSTLLPPVYVDEEETLDDCFDILNNEQTHMALVKNKEGAITGLVTMDDILSELVGHLDEIPPKRRGKAL